MNITMNTIIATWNVNSLKCRMDKVLDYLTVYSPLVLALQEVRCDEQKIKSVSFEDLGYGFCCHSKGGRNGVAILYRKKDVEIISIHKDLHQQPLYDGEVETRSVCIEMKICSTNKTYNIYSVYVPNGRSVDHPHFQYKLKWLECLKNDIAGKENVILLGDFNVAPRNCDVWDIDAWIGCTHVSKEERDKVTDLNLTDVIPMYGLEGGKQTSSIFSFWGYIGGLFWKDKGMRIDLILTNVKCKNAHVNRDYRKLAKPSDHTLVIMELIF